MSADLDRMSVIDHLAELRKRLIIALAALALGVVVAFVFQGPIFEILKRPLAQAPNVEPELITLSPAEPFLTVLKVSVAAGLLIALPVVLWQFWAFVMPALYESERRRVLPYAAFTTVLFLAGVAFGYFVVLPIGLAFLVGYGGEIFDQQLRASDYIGFVTTFLMAFGVVFEIPALMVLLASAGLVNHVILGRLRKYALLVIAVISMLLTPQDPFSMVLMILPLYVLYELGIILTRIVDRRRAKRALETP